jgi:outer membrane lipoprotein-sorting protein
LWLTLALAQDTATVLTGDAKMAFLQEWSARLQAMRSLHMVFSQEKHLRMLHRPLRTQGELWMQGETMLYTLSNAAGTPELTLRLDKEAVQTYYPLLNTLEVIDLRQTGPVPMALPFFHTDPETLAREYDVEVTVMSGRHTLRIVPRQATAALQEMQLVLKDFQPEEVLNVEKNGTRVIMRITAFHPNVEIAEAQLTLSVPPQTHMTYPLR